ncbi:hypothetical protein EDC94DRAFT_595141 [Helicostylum pulchrum]|nr:hypothetical protein EDC94DRAFT_595141 [Helicostylum pulchrum]
MIINKDASVLSQDLNQKFKEKNDERYPWLQEQKDLQGNAIGSPGYDSHTLFFPVNAWTKFIPFERQYWEFKQKCMNKIVFFQKGKFY